ncbi:MAG: phosphoribosylamine--glycine ligase [Desulfurivibrionaceae bacterium]
MKVLVVGSGGREHALVWKLSRSTRVDKVFCAPGNGGIAGLASCVDISDQDIPGLCSFAETNGIDLTVVGPEVPLVKGIVDAFSEKGLRIFGPGSKAARLEGSKVFSKELMEKYGIPTGKYLTCKSREEAFAGLKTLGLPVVIKADGLAAGKGVIVAHSESEARSAVDKIMSDREFGEAGRIVVLEEFLRGQEASFIALTDGKTVLPLPSSKDHKAAYDGDQGPNTGGMGAFSPSPLIDEVLERRIIEEVMLPTVRALANEDSPFKGILYAGLMIDEGNPVVLEYNCRLGDPEAQPILMRLQNDLVDIFEAVIDERLDEVVLNIDPRPSVCVVMASGGYPGLYEKGKKISGLDQADRHEDVMVFHAGTSVENNTLVTSGGRVLGVTALGQDLNEAVEKAYEVVDRIHWQGCFYRKDIGRKVPLESKNSPLVGIVMGSDSDLPAMKAAADFLKSMGIPYEITVASAHRTPGRALSYAENARKRGLKVIIAGAGMAAHLAGVLAAHTTLPVIGVPMEAAALKGLDALLSTVQMPPGIPVATMGIGKSGAKNAAILAVQILSLTDSGLEKKLVEFKEDMARQVDEADKNLQIQET